MLDFQQEIHVQSLSRTFQDALSITLRLGFSYIWIDSLCIVQDLPEDWLYESSRMGEVYKHSSCNIAATGFANGEHGLFVERSPQEITWPRVSVEWAGAWWDDEPRMGQFYLVDYDLWDNEVSDAPLNKRGWVLQERLLSPCVLHFGARQIFWECFEAYNCELHPTGLPRGISKPHNFKSIRFYRDRLSEYGELDTRKEIHHGSFSTKPQSKRQNIYDSWHEIVSTYSAGTLTRSTDKLVAISGAAKEVRQILGDRYLAGLWEHNIMRDLLWFLQHRNDGENVGLPFPIRAPSWSWASIDAEVMYLSGTDKETIHTSLVQAHVDIATKDDTGMVRGGYLRLRGPLTKASPVDGEWSAVANTWCINNLKVHLEVDFDMPPIWRAQEGPALRLQQAHDGVFSMSIGSRFVKQLLARQDFYVLPILNDEDPYTKSLYDYGLLLSPTGAANGEYIRIGRFEAQDEESQEALFKTGERLPRTCYERCDNSMTPLQYTIKIL
ncbi:hypothetical protein LTR67_007324 [Exophiala xenobiotica]